MPTTPRRFLGYEQSRGVPNIVVDGSPNEATVLTLTHWPGQPQPPGTDVDTSAEMVFAHLDDPTGHQPADVVTNNHFDQDGAVGLFALTDPAAALDERERLVDLAAAGDFGTYRYREAARASMILSAFADPLRSPLSEDLTGDPATDTAYLYQSVLPRLVEMVTDPLGYEDLWAAEDEVLSASEEAIDDGRVRITEYVDLDLAVIEIDSTEPERRGHRFGHLYGGPIHPMAVHNATERTRLLMVHGNRFSYVDRYETWVQFHTRTPPFRVDLGPLAEALNRAESGSATWEAKPPSALTPVLDHDHDSSLGIDAVVAAVRHHLRTAPPAWDPFPSGH
ncbi:MAG: hypothetical protein GY929_24675 [Actinomycetia bacterium]|nr:hypothetical protein [Actinomycetes bacterium]